MGSQRVHAGVTSMRRFSRRSSTVSPARTSHGRVGIPSEGTARASDALLAVQERIPGHRTSADCWHSVAGSQKVVSRPRISYSCRPPVGSRHAAQAAGAPAGHGGRCPTASWAIKRSGCPYGCLRRAMGEECDAKRPSPRSTPAKGRLRLLEGASRHGALKRQDVNPWP